MLMCWRAGACWFVVVLVCKSVDDQHTCSTTSQHTSITAMQHAPESQHISATANTIMIVMFVCCCCADVLVCYIAGLLCCSAVVLMCWRVGLLLCWCVDALVYLFAVVLVC